MEHIGLLRITFKELAFRLGLPEGDVIIDVEKDEPMRHNTVLVKVRGDGFTPTREGYAVDAWEYNNYVR